MKKVFLFLTATFLFLNLFAQREVRVLTDSKNDREVTFPEVRYTEGAFSFENYEEFLKVSDILEELSRVNVEGIKNEELEEYCVYNPGLDAFEKRFKGYKSLRKKYEENECRLLANEDIDPVQIPKCPILENGSATLVNADGNIIIGDEVINYYSEKIILRTKLRNFRQLSEVIRSGNLDLIVCGSDTNGDSEIDENDDAPDNGVIATVRGGSPCSADFSYTTNNSTGDVFLTYSGSTSPGQWEWGIPNTTNKYKNENYVQISQLQPGTYEVCVTYAHKVDKKGSKPGSLDSIVCQQVKCATITIGGCNPNFDINKAMDGTVQFTNKSTVVTGTVDKVEWTFGDGAKSNEWSPSHTYPCDKEFKVTLTIWSKSCPGGVKTLTKSVDITEKDCCDRNPYSNWREKTYEDKKKLEYKYDLGSVIIWDQRFVAKMINWELRKGGLFNSEKWRRTAVDMHADVLGKLYNIDEEGCYCINPYTLDEKPDVAINREDHTFKDKLDGFKARKNWARMKKNDPVFIDFTINGNLIVKMNCVTDGSGFGCE